MAPSYDAARNRAVLEVGPVTYRWRHVEALARRFGDWSSFERQVRSGLVAISAVRRLGTEPSDEEIRETEKAFRRQRRLLAAEDVERWLSGRRLTVADWRSWLRRELVRQEADHLGDGQPTEREVDAALWVDGVCSGRLGSFANQLAAKAAIFGRAAEADRTLHRNAAPSPDALVAVYDRVVASEQQAGRLEQVIREHQLEWTLVRAEAVVFEAEDAAREAVASLIDGRPIEEVAELADTRVGLVEGPLAQMSDGLRPDLLAAAPGTVIGPIRTVDGWTALRLVDRRSASLDVPEVVAAARRMVERQLTAREVDARVIWHDRV